MSKTTTTICDICKEEITEHAKLDMQTVWLDGVECRVGLDHWVMRPPPARESVAFSTFGQRSLDLCPKHDHMALTQYLEAIDFLPLLRSQEE